MGRAPQLALGQAARGNIAPWQPGPLGHYGFVAQNIKAVFPALEE